MKIYAKFCNNYDAADALYKQKIKKKEFEAFLNVSKMLNVIYGTMHAVIGVYKCLYFMNFTFHCTSLEEINAP